MKAFDQKVLASCSNIRGATQAWGGAEYGFDCPCFATKKFESHMLCTPHAMDSPSHAPHPGDGGVAKHGGSLMGAIALMLWINYV